MPALEASVFLGFVFPGELAVILGGVAAWEGRAPLWAVIVAAVSGAIIGDSVGYEIGRHWGEALLRGSFGRVPFIRERLDRHLGSARDYVRRRAGRSVFFGRFTTALRVMVPGIAGMSEVPYGSFLLYNAAGGALWGAGFAVLGFVAGVSYHRVEKIAGWVGLGLLAAIVILLVVTRLVRRGKVGARAKDLTRRISSSRPVAWAIKRYPAQVRWLQRRIDPGEPRGFALTLPIAIAALAAWALGGLIQDVVAHDEIVLTDPRFTAWAVDHRTGWLTTLMKILSWLGANAVVIPVAAAVVLLLILRGRDFRSSVVVAVAVGGSIAAYAILEPWVARPRPPSAIWIERFSGYSFPSGHASVSVAAYGALAYVLSKGRSPVAKAAIWSSAIAIGLVVGVSQVYLGGHWLSDVLGGYALAVAWLALVIAGSIWTRPDR